MRFLSRIPAATGWAILLTPPSIEPTWTTQFATAGEEPQKFACIAAQLGWSGYPRGEKMFWPRLPAPVTDLIDRQAEGCRLRHVAGCSRHRNGRSV